MKKFSLAAAVLLIFPALLLFFLLFTESGLRFAVYSAEKLTRGQLGVEKAAGTLGSSFTAEGLSYSSAGQDLDLQSLAVSWNPAMLFRGKVHFNFLFVDGLHFRGSAETSEEKEGTFSLPEIKLPLSVVMDDLQVKDIVLLSDPAMVITIDSIILEAVAGGKTLRMNTLNLRNEFLDLHMRGTVAPNGRWPVDLEGEYSYVSGDFPRLGGNFRITDTLEEGSVRISLNSPFNAEIDGSFSITEGVRFQAKLQADNFDPALVHRGLSGFLAGSATVNGHVAEEGFSADIDLSTIEGRLNDHPLRLSGKARFEDGSLDIAGAVLKSGASHLQAAGSIGSEYDLACSLSVPDVAAFIPEAAGALKLQGNLTGNLSRPLLRAALRGENLAAEDFTVSLLEAEVSAEAAIDGMIEATASFRNIERQGTVLEQIIVKAAGNTDSHRLELSAVRDDISFFLAAEGALQEQTWRGTVDALDLSHPQRGDLTLVEPAALVVRPQEISVGELCLTHEAALMCLQGELLNERWQAKALLRNVDPGYLFEQWPGDIDALLTGHGELSGSSLHSIELSELSGNLKDLPLAGAGSLEIRGESVDVLAFDLTYGDAYLTTEGTVSSDGYDLVFSTKVPDFQTFMADLQGRMTLSGNLAGSREAPVLQIEMTAEDGKMNDFTFGAVSGDISLDLHREGALNIDIQADAITGNQLEIAEAVLQAAGTTADHAFKIHAQTGLGDALVEGSGSYGSSWKGILKTAAFSAGRYGVWALSEDAFLEIGPQKSSVEKFCLQGDQGGLCLSGSLHENMWSVRSVGDDLPLAMLNNLGLAGFQVQGNLQADFSAQGQGNRISHVQGSVLVPKLLLAADAGEELTYTFLESRIDIETSAEDTLNMRLRSNFEESGVLQGYLNIHQFNGDIAVLAAMPIQGELDFDLPELSFIALLSNSRIIPTGNLQGRLDFAGSFEDPKMLGSIDLNQGEVHIADLGITLEEVSAEVSSVWENAAFQFTARSGPGRITGDGKFSFGLAEGWDLTCHFSGSDFEVMATEEYVIQASPKIQLNAGEGGNSVSGEVKIPYARILLQGSTGQITPSDDVVIVDEPEEQPVATPFSIDLAVSLGDDVRIDAYGLKSRLAGTIELEDRPGRILSAFGELVVQEGEFTFYSVELDITRGRLLFSGESVDNPGLDFRARRKVENIVVGVMVGGTAEEPEFQLFSDPAMEESNILAYLLVGRSMYASTDNDQSLIGAAASALGIRGVNSITNTLTKYVPVDEVYLNGSTSSQDMSIVFGKNITEDLFVGYDHNFFDSSGKFKVRYDLGKNFSVETSSSAESSSGDILYSIEK